jgi:hypothetical protein
MTLEFDDTSAEPTMTATTCITTTTAATKNRNPGRHDGQAAMRKLVELTDKHGVWISLLAVADYHRHNVGTSLGPRTDPAWLRSFYRSFGFIPADGGITAESDYT